MKKESKYKKYLEMQEALSSMDGENNILIKDYISHIEKLKSSNSTNFENYFKNAYFYYSKNSSNKEGNDIEIYDTSSNDKNKNKNKAKAKAKAKTKSNLQKIFIKDIFRYQTESLKTRFFRLPDIAKKRFLSKYLKSKKDEKKARLYAIFGLHDFYLFSWESFLRFLIWTIFPWVIVFFLVRDIYHYHFSTNMIVLDSFLNQVIHIGSYTISFYDISILILFILFINWVINIIFINKKAAKYNNIIISTILYDIETAILYNIGLYELKEEINK